MSEPGEDWTHRIDACPQINRDVEFRLLDCKEIRRGTVNLARDTERAKFNGIGCHLVYQSHGCRYLSVEVEYWRYAA